MSYYFAIVGTRDNPLFEYEFGTSKQSGDGLSRFRDEAKHLNQFIVHSSIDIVEEVQWTNGCMYHKCIDRFYNNYISLFLTGTTVKFLLLHCPDPVASSNPAAAFDSSHTFHSHSSSISSTAAGAAGSSGAGSGTSSRASRIASSSIAANPTSPATEEAIRQFFADVYENWVKTVMSPFYLRDMPVRSPVFRQRVVAAGKKYL